MLTVGDGDLSFSLALCRALVSIELIATTWLTEDELAARYQSAATAAWLALGQGEV